MNLKKAFICASLTASLLYLGGCGDSNETHKPGASIADHSSRATIAVLGQNDFIPDRTQISSGDTVGLPEVLSSRIIENLTNSNRFTPVERSALRKVILEQRFGQDIAQTYLDRTLDKAISAMEDVEASTVGVTGSLADYNDLLKNFQDLGTAVGAEYLVVGNLEKLDRSKSSTAVPYSTEGRKQSQTNVAGRLQLRVIEVESGTVLGAASINATLSETVFQGGSAGSDEFAIYDQLGQLAASKILDLTFPARIVSIDPLVISRGKIDGVRNGDEFALLREGKEISDGSGQVISRLTSEVGTVRVIDAQNIISVVEASSGDSPSMDDLVRIGAGNIRNSTHSPGATTASLRSQTGGQLPRLAVGLVKSGSTAKTGDDAGKHTAIFTDSIISRLVQTKRFQLIDRQEVDQLLDEQMAQALANNQEMSSALGALQGADYLAYGNLDSSSFTSETEMLQLPNSTRVIEQTKWYVSGNMRIVDARSGHILESRKISVEESPPASMDKRRILTTLADAYAEQVVLMLMNAVYPIKVAAIGQDRSVYVNRGSDGGLSVGEVLDAFRPGNAVIDPDTGVQLGVEEVAVGQVSLVEVEDARSKGMAVDGVLLGVGDILKRTVENRDKRSSQARQAATGDSRSGAQLPGTQSGTGGKDNRFTLAVGQLKLNPSARTTGFDSRQLNVMSDDLMAKLTNTNRFRVMERQEVDQILDEKAFEAIASGAEIQSRLQELIGADYLVHGEIANFYIDTTTRDVAYLDETETNASAVAEGIFRMVDVHSGAIVGADKVRYQASASNVKDATVLMSDLMDQFTTEAVAAIVLRLFPIKVLGQTADGTVFVNRGADAGLVSGDVFVVMRPGEEMIDPDTGLSFGVAETEIARLEIVSVESSRSRAKIVSGSAVEAGDIVREVPAQKPIAEPKVREPDF